MKTAYMWTYIAITMFVASLYFLAFIHVTDRSIVVNCSSFPNHQAAQTYFEAHHLKKLDHDNNGIACEK